MSCSGDYGNTSNTSDPICNFYFKTDVAYQSAFYLEKKRSGVSSSLGTSSHYWDIGYIKTIDSTQLNVSDGININSNQFLVSKNNEYIEIGGSKGKISTNYSVIADSLTSKVGTKPFLCLSGGYGYWCLASMEAGYFRTGSAGLLGYSDSTSNKASWDIGIDGRSPSSSYKKDARYRFCISLSGSDKNLPPRHSFAFTVHNEDDSVYFIARKRKTETETDEDGNVSQSYDWGTNANSYLGSSSVKWGHLYVNHINGENISGGTLKNTDSDFRLKNIQSNNILEKVLNVYNNLTTVAYKYKNLQEGQNHKRTHIGFIAQEVEQQIFN